VERLRGKTRDAARFSGKKSMRKAYFNGNDRSDS